jgi:competence protein ComEC
MMMSIAAQMATMPLTLHYFGQTSNYFALTNLLVIPMAGVILLLGFGTLALSWCVVGEWLGVATKWCTWLLREAVEWVDSLPYATTQMSLSEWGVMGLYGALVCGMLMLSGKHVRWWLIGVVVSLLGVLVVEIYGSV